jgi:chloramphenicol O-acetyltransferase type A
VRYIDVETWNRREYFTAYVGRDFPYINLTADIDVTGLVSFCKKSDLSSYLALIHTAHHTASRIENFHYRTVDGRPVAFDEMGVTFTYRPEDAELFVNVIVPFAEDLREFHAIAREAAEWQGSDPGFAGFAGRSDLIYYSAIPWVRYTHLIRTINHLGVDTAPKVSWGKYFEQGGRMLVPFSVQVHHGMMDGYHVGLYYEAIQSALDTFGG